MTDLTSLVTAAQQQDTRAFRELVDRFQDMAYAMAYGMTKDRDHAEDAAQEAFIEAYFQLSQLKEPAAFPGWFRRIVFKQGDRIIRKRRLMAVPIEGVGELPSPHPGPVDDVEAGELRDLLNGAIDTLPDHERIATSLFYITGYSYKEVAEWLEIPISTVKKRLHDARKRLKNQLMDTARDYLFLTLRSMGISDSVVTVCAQTADPPEARTDALRTGVTLAEYFRDREHRDVLVILDDRILNDETEKLTGWIGPTDQGTITAVYLDQDESKAMTRDSRLVFNRAIFEREIYPAVDPGISGSRLLEAGLVDETHVRVAEQVRALIAEDETAERSLRAHMFCTQPFFVAQFFTNIPGTVVPLATTITDFEALLNGTYDSMPAGAFRLIGSADQAQV